MADLTWNKEDLDFNEWGQLVIRNKELIKRIEEAVNERGMLELNLLSDVGCGLNRKCPIPPNTVCGCEARPWEPPKVGQS